jgi:glutamine---fructose-6-phosphate transaminase (isomerizing)
MIRGNIRMCGIIGVISKKPFSIKEILLASLSRLEYRGYDSVGYSANDCKINKEIGYISEFISSQKDNTVKVAIGHTRWATHGGVTKINSHPHSNQDKTIVAVHNGIIENYEEKKKYLESKGYSFISETDSELIPHYFDYYLKKGLTMKDCIIRFMDEISGTFAILIIRKDEEKIYALKRSSPLVLGISKDSYYLASDIYAFSDKTNEAIFFEDEEFCIVDENSYSIFDKNGYNLEKEINRFILHEGVAGKEKYDHYMIKEIKEQPEVSSRLIESFKNTQKNKIDIFAEKIKKNKRVVFLACGTSYHASLIGVHLLNRIGIKSHAIIASEFENFFLVDKDTLVVAISQSGETMDVVSVLKEIKDIGADITSIVNVPYSTIQRMSSLSLETLAGPEICVASTKVFTNQVISLLGIARGLGYTTELDDIPNNIQNTIDKNEKNVITVAEELADKKDIFIIGRGLSYPVSREIALKLKEIPYIHAEGMMAGELKHGTIALIEPGVPVISLVCNNNSDMISNTREVEARGAKVFSISNIKGDFEVPNCDEVQFAIYASIIGHLLSYYIAKLKNLPIDKPRNLAKSVTVK